ncbi:ladderlectin-like [Saccostrea echinata]|uniref:ladderlectin-like n=1 Tax=Saccostrea echinata TaxID=191078 RepID=UPI002A7EB789|nr:ladderlectin-like [Saccostrea echinata]
MISFVNSTSRNKMTSARSLIFLLTVAMMFNFSHSRHCRGSSSRCPPGWHRHGNSCYMFSKNTLPWNQALHTCVSLGAGLVAVESHREEKFLQNRLRHEFASFMFWLGGSDQYHEHSVWYWIATEKNINSGYTDWHRSEPDHPGTLSQSSLKVF